MYTRYRRPFAARDRFNSILLHRLAGTIAQSSRSALTSPGHREMSYPDLEQFRGLRTHFCSTVLHQHGDAILSLPPFQHITQSLPAHLGPRRDGVPYNGFGTDNGIAVGYSLVFV
ncbi:unnamed protein product [Nezara viridula]|uniref:Uncharacterized protein n=1 Tax=Nezara viridula TaxID=85310 RepID=A0A9P0MP23_NEZVI|nr:unnamed protein product [Nezara viridula]